MFMASKLLTIARDADIDGGVRARALESLGEIQPYGTSDMLVSTLHDAPRDAADVAAPAVVVIGDVLGLR